MMSFKHAAVLLNRSEAVCVKKGVVSYGDVGNGVRCAAETFPLFVAHTPAAAGPEVLQSCVFWLPGQVRSDGQLMYGPPTGSDDCGRVL